MEFDYDKVSEICNRCISDSEPFVLAFPPDVNIRAVVDAGDKTTLLNSSWAASFLNGDDYPMNGLEVFAVLKMMHNMRERIDENAKIFAEKGIEEASVNIQCSMSPDEFTCEAFDRYLSMCRIAIFPPSVDRWPYVPSKVEDEEPIASPVKPKSKNSPPEGDQSWRDKIE